MLMAMAQKVAQEVADPGQGIEQAEHDADGDGGDVDQRRPRDQPWSR
ncbi:hypothetical protein X726_07630 [Mesorhizobium sp. L103C105A0]|nr:hypothetical protein X726_07630 [Mesorhizobium sp. L103C105A0]